MIENKVVLPAPLGPISATISPGMTWALTLSTARRPPKLLQTPLTVNSGSAIATSPRLEASPRDAGKAVGQEQHHDDQHDAVQHQIEPDGVAHGLFGDLACAVQHDGAQDRAE